MGTTVARGAQHSIKVNMNKIVKPLRSWRGTTDEDKASRQKLSQKGQGPYGFPNQWPELWTDGERPMEFEEAINFVKPDQLDKVRLNKKIVDQYIA